MLVIGLNESKHHTTYNHHLQSHRSRFSGSSPVPQTRQRSSSRSTFSPSGWYFCVRGRWKKADKIHCMGTCGVRSECTGWLVKGKGHLSLAPLALLLCTGPCLATCLVSHRAVMDSVATRLHTPACAARQPPPPKVCLSSVYVGCSLGLETDRLPSACAVCSQSSPAASSSII